MAFCIGWWFVCNTEEQQGWAPATYLEPISAESEEESDEWMAIDDSDTEGMLSQFFTLAHALLVLYFTIQQSHDMGVSFYLPCLPNHSRSCLC